MVDGAPPSINAESFDESSTGVTEFIAETKLPTDRGFYRLRGYRHSVDGAYPTEPVAIVYGDIEGKEKARGGKGQLSAYSHHHHVYLCIYLSRLRSSVFLFFFF